MCRQLSIIFSHLKKASYEPVCFIYRKWWYIIKHICEEIDAFHINLLIHILILELPHFPAYSYLLFCSHRGWYKKGSSTRLEKQHTYITVTGSCIQLMLIKARKLKHKSQNLSVVHCTECRNVSKVQEQLPRCSFDIQDQQKTK